MLKKYFRRRDKFVAVQFRESHFEEIRELTRGRLYHDTERNQYLLFTYGHEFIMKDGDYIVGDRSDFEVWSEDVFESLFEEVPGQDDNEGGERRWN